MSGSASAQDASHDYERPSLTVVHAPTPPKIDGVLDDEVWKLAVRDGRFTQSDPREGDPPTEMTEIRALYDADNLYVAIRCFDREPKKIIATQMRRDAPLETDDRVYVVIDTFEDHRNGYLFEINPAGAKLDALIASNGRGTNTNWDGIWEGRASIDDQGWSAELAIPFKTLSFEPGRTRWGFNAQRAIKRRLETDRWASPQRNHSVTQVSEAGALEGLVGLQQGLGIDFVPFFAAHYDDDGDDQLLTGKPGFDLFYRLTPSLGAALTVNTDFAETEVDQRRVNLTRFPLFFPEKRDFFLQDSGIFQFADLGTDLVPFFSRRIGRTDAGEEVPILVGGKVTGRIDDFNIGVLDVSTDAAHGFERANLAAARVSMNVGEQSSIGVIGTHGDPNGVDENSLAGVDANFGTSAFLGDQNLRSSVWALETFDDSRFDDDSAFGVSVSYPNDVWSWNVAAKQVGEDFHPALGFVPRTGIRSYAAQLEYRPIVNREIRWFEFGVAPVVITDLDDRVESSATVLQPFGAVWDAGDELRLQVIPNYERLDQPFDISNGVTIAPGEYDWVRWRVESESALKRPVSGTLAVETGDFYDGTRTDYEASAAWRPTRYFNGEVGYTQNRVYLPAGDFVVHVAFTRLDFAFSPDVTWSNFVQYDNESDSIGLNSRFQWIVRPGEDVTFVFNDLWERPDDTFVSTQRSAAFKLQYTLRL